MRTLLIDNYDSYTHILAQDLWLAFGEKPIVVKNDSLSLEEIRDLDVDAIVISPGPGRPGVAEDFGVCAAVIETFHTTPILGVCLGHQGLGTCFGATIVHAPRAMHGKVSAIEHDGTGLFEGVPPGFKAVRYHSLVLSPAALPDSVRVTACAADDGSIMAIAIEGRPFHGVQFHPESVGTEHGQRILQNFRKLCERARAARGRRATDSIVELAQLPWVEPDRVFAGLFNEAPYAFWLDSSASDARSAFSFMGRATKVIEAKGNAISIKSVGTTGEAPSTRLAHRSFFRALEAHLRDNDAADANVPFGFTGGLVGYFGYELREHLGFGTSAHAAPALPDGLMMVAREILAFDHANKRIYACAVGRDAHARRAWLESVPDRLRKAPALAELSVANDPAARIAFESCTIQPATPREEYLRSIGVILDKIRDGETYQVCLTNEFRISANVDPFRLYRILRLTNPAPYSAFLRLPEGSILSSSPECFLRVDRARRVESEPIKGTRRRGSTSEETAALRTELESSDKDQSELLMVTDLVRSDLGRVCERGSIAVDRLMHVTEHPTVLQLSSRISGTLLPERTALDAVESCFPGGSITGAPKHRTTSIIDALEGRARGVYTGSIGYLSYEGTMDLNIAIRTIVAEAGKVRIGVGGGIVAQSEPEAEYEEICVKAFALVRAVNLEQNGEHVNEHGTMRLVSSPVPCPLGAERATLDRPGSP